MATFKKRDDVLWLRHLRDLGINVDGTSATRFRVNEMEIDFVPMKPSGGNPTPGLKAAGPNARRWNEIAKGAPIKLEPILSSAPPELIRAPVRATKAEAKAAQGEGANAIVDADLLTTRNATKPSLAFSLPDAGAVGGFDTGYSDKPTTGLCILHWTPTTIVWSLRNATRHEADRRAKLAGIAPTEGRVLAVAVDGSLVPALGNTTRYRAAEAVLSAGALQKRGKPGPTNGGSGPELHREATRLAEFALVELRIATAVHATPIHERAVVEAFPNLFLGSLCDERDYPDRPSRSRKWTDELFGIPEVRARFFDLLRAVLPSREVPSSATITDHEEIAALTCAVTALCVASGHYTAVGACEDGYVILPPASFMGVGWRETLLTNLKRAQRNFPTATIEWMG